MGISNCCVFGKYEGLYFIDYDDIHVFRHKDCDPDGSAEARFLRDLDYGELTGGDWIFDDLATQFVQQEVLDSFTSDFLRMFPNFSKTCPDLWISRSQKAILESPLFYLCLEDTFCRIQGADPKRAAAGPVLRGPPGQVLPAVLDRDRAVPAEPSAQRRALYGSLDFRVPQARRTERMTLSGQARQTIGHLIEEVPYEK